MTLAPPHAVYSSVPPPIAVVAAAPVRQFGPAALLKVVCGSSSDRPAQNMWSSKSLTTRSCGLAFPVEADDVLRVDGQRHVLLARHQPVLYIVARLQAWPPMTCRPQSVLS